MPTLALEADDASDEGDNVECTRILEGAEADRLREAAARFGVSLNNLVQAAWALVLARYNQVEDVTFGSVRAGSWGHGTGAEAIDRGVGLFVDTVPFRVQVMPDACLGTWLEAIREQQRELRCAEYVSREDMRRAAGLSPREWLFRSVLMFESHDPVERMEGDPGAGGVELREKVDLPVLAVYAGKRLRLVMAAPERLHGEEQLRFGLGHVRQILLAMAGAGKEARLGDLVMVTDEERVPMFGAWQGPVVPLPERAFHRLLEDQAAKTPEAPALEFEGVVFGYAAVHAWANRMARRLRELASPGDRVCVILERCPEQPVVWLATLKAGLVYAPIDPGNPPRRMAFFLQDLSPAVVVRS